MWVPSSSIHHYIVVFVFYSAVTHRDLHSFPTRRSSDLGFSRSNGATRTKLATGWRNPSPRRARRRGPSPGAARDFARDRKSTRLNSSHGYISYAVFCLKKKNKKKNIDNHTTHPKHHRWL